MIEQSSYDWLQRLDQDVSTAITHQDLIYAITPETLGVLWADILLNQRNSSCEVNNLASLLYRKVKEQQLQPALNSTTALRVLPLARDWQEIVTYLSWLCEPPTLGLTAAICQQFASENPQQVVPVDRYCSAAMARFSGEAALTRWQQAVSEDFKDQNIILLETSFIPKLSLSSIFTLFSFGKGYFKAGEEDPARQLSEDPAYCSFAHQALSQAIAHLESIHNQPVTYRADGAFSVEEAHVIARAARVAAWRDEGWFRDGFPRLLELVCYAPGEAKTVPSQSLAIALGHGVESTPTPESLAALQNCVANIRHAGVQKKLMRNVKPAQAALAMRGEYAFRGISPVKSKKQSENLLKVLETGVYYDSHYSWEDWFQVVSQFGWVKDICCQLIWQLESAPGIYHSTMPVANKWVDCQGNSCALPESQRLRLWHPLQVSPAEHQAWQNYLTESGIEQPFKQAFREIYYATSIRDFAGYTLDLQRLVGLARAEGWKIQYDTLERWFGSYLFVFSMDTGLYPGVQGQGGSGDIICYHKISSRLVRITDDQLPAVVLSEALRAVDLLVSMSALARGEKRYETEFATMKEALDYRIALVEQQFADEIAHHRLTLAGHYAQVGDHRLHLTTGRVTCHGKPVIVPSILLPDSPGDALSGELLIILNQLLS